MKVGLIDIDSKIPNLALMKLSAYFKSDGYETELTSPLFADQYGVLYASKVFDFTPDPVLPEHTVKGGSGYSLADTLDKEIEVMKPDYTLYPCDYAMGFTTRGCYRKCPYCIVPEKEGKFRIVGDVHDFWDGQYRVMLLDNALNTDQEHFLRICGQLSGLNVEVDFSQGLDIRYFNDTQAWALSKVRLWKQIHWAWDMMVLEQRVRNGIKILAQHKLVNKSMFYVLIGYDTTPEEDLYRVKTLRGLGIDPFVIPYDKFDTYQRQFARWVNHKAIFKSVAWEEYRP